jgi:hypothetical protein
MTHCYLRAMSPIHIKCLSSSPEKYCTDISFLVDLGNMGVRASMSIVSLSLKLFHTRLLTTKPRLVNRGVQQALGSDHMPLLWKPRNACIVPREADVAPTK